MAAKESNVADGFTCPITCLVMRDPVMLTADGHTYERFAVERWLKLGKATSPLTGAAIDPKTAMVVPNHAVRKAISELNLELPSQADIEDACGIEGPSAEENPLFVTPVKSRTREYNEDNIFIFASLRRSLYSLDSTVCMWKGKQLCLPCRTTSSKIEPNWDSKMRAQVTCMKGLDKERIVVSGSRDKTLRVWELPHEGEASSSSSSSSVRHLRETQAVKGHTDWITCLDANSSEDIVVTGSRDCSLKVWDTMKWRCNHTMRTSDYVNCVAFDRVKNGFFVSGGENWKLLLWDCATLRQSVELSGHTYAVKCCAVDPVSASWIVSSGDDSKLCVWSTESKECMVEVESAGGDNNESVLCCSVSSDGRLVACGLANKRIAIWDTRMWKVLQNLDGHNSGVEDLCFVPGFASEKLVSVDGRALKSWSCESNDWVCQHSVTAHAIACCGMATY